MAFLRKSINIISPSDGKHYDSITKYEKSLDQRGQHIMSDGEYRRLSEKLRDESHSQRRKTEDFNHVHIDVANDRIIKSKKDL